jgi:hypothetical protein
MTGASISPVYPDREAVEPFRKVRRRIWGIPQAFLLDLDIAHRQHLDDEDFGLKE